MLDDLPQYRLVIFDWDGTLAIPKVGRVTTSGAVFPLDPYDYEPMPGRVERLRVLRECGVSLAVATNQGGIAFGIHDRAEMSRAIGSLSWEWFGIRKFALCPHHPKGKPETGFAVSDCTCRKPKPGMLLGLMRLCDTPPDQTLFVGDMDTDEQAAHNAGCVYCDAGMFFAV